MMTEWIAFLPEILTCVLSAGLLMRSLNSKPIHQPRLDRALLVGAAIILGSTFLTINARVPLFSGTYRIDLFSQTIKLGLSLALLLTHLVSSQSAAIPEKRRLENAFFSLTATLGMMMMASSLNWLSLFVGIELSAYSLYLLVALRREPRYAESNVKYLILGAAASGVLLWGISLVCGLSSTMDLLRPEITNLLWAQPAFRLGMFFIVLALLFKLAAFPMHFWAPDVYQGASIPTTLFLSTASKVAAVAVLIRFFGSYGIPQPLVLLIGGLAFLSMTLGNTAALLQTDLKRLMAYSSISQAGYILLGLMAGSFQAYSSAVFYALAYVLMNSAVFLAASQIALANRNDNPSLSDFDGFAEKSPFLALILLLGLLSLAGIPPLAGFTAKWVLFSAAMDKGHWFLVLWAVLNSVVSLFYYLTLVKHAYLMKPKNDTRVTLDWGTKALGIFLFVALVGLGVFPAPILTLARFAIGAGLTL